jgi:hypothetical protein
MNKKNLVTILIILGVIILSIIVISRGSGVSQQTAMCIGQKSILYTQLGCHACKIQQDMFGENYQYLNVVDCWIEREKCEGIKKTPTWIIKGEKYEKVLSIEKLKELTGC